MVSTSKVTEGICWQYVGMTNYQKFFINGKWVASSSSDTIQVFDSTDESVMATIPAGTAADVDAAAKAAHDAFESCRNAPSTSAASEMDSRDAWMRLRPPFHAKPAW